VVPNTGVVVTEATGGAVVKGVLVGDGLLPVPVETEVLGLLGWSF
jgi:hypothetical protein